MFQFWAVVNKVAINADFQVFGQICGSEIAITKLFFIAALYLRIECI